MIIKKLIILKSVYSRPFLLSEDSSLACNEYCRAFMTHSRHQLEDRRGDKDGRVIGAGMEGMFRGVYDRGGKLEAVDLA